MLSEGDAAPLLQAFTTPTLRDFVLAGPAHRAALGEFARSRDVAASLQAFEAMERRVMALWGSCT